MSYPRMACPLCGKDCAIINERGAWPVLATHYPTGDHWPCRNCPGHMVWHWTAGADSMIRSDLRQAVLYDQLGAYLRATVGLLASTGGLDGEFMERWSAAWTRVG